jgi:hypothetical protein
MLFSRIVEIILYAGLVVMAWLLWCLYAGTRCFTLDLESTPFSVTVHRLGCPGHFGIG